MRFFLAKVCKLNLGRRLLPKIGKVDVCYSDAFRSALGHETQN